MRRGKLLLGVLVMSAVMTFPAFAGEWKNDNQGWWYQNDDGSYPVNQWQEIGGKQYYFDGSGYMLANTTAPDGKRVGADGAMIQTESVSQITYTSDSATQELVSSDWICTWYSTTYHVFEVTNNSPYTIRLNINESAKNGAGELVGGKSTSENDIPPGCTIFLRNSYSNTEDVAGFETTFQTKIEDYYVPVLQDIAVEASKGSEKVIVKITNNGGIPAEFPEATAVFFKRGKMVRVGSAYLTDADYEIKPGAVIIEEIRCSDDFDEVRVHLTARGRK